jgi:hypothetical protein
MNKKLIYILLIIFTPFFWWNLLNPKIIISEYLKLPQYIQNQQKQYFSVEKLIPVGEMRWHSINSSIGRIFFNKLYVIPDEIFYGLKTIFPKAIFSPSSEPNSISLILLPFCLIGFLTLIKEKKYKYIYLYFMTSLIPIITGQTSKYFLIPTLFLYLYFCFYCLKNLSKKCNTVIFILLIIHNIFIFAYHYWL